MAEVPATEYELMVAHRNQGALTQKEFDIWSLRNFSAVPGIHLRLDKRKGTTWDLAAFDGTVWATCHGGSFTHFHQLWRRIEVGDESYRWRGFAKTIRKSHELVAGSSSEVVLRMSGTHFQGATTRVELVGHDTYEFPVNNGIMTAVDSSGSTLAQYRLDRSRIKVNPDPRKMIEVAVDPSACNIPGFRLVVAVSALFLSRFSEIPVGRMIN
jgi:hypothetical protein